MRIIVDLEQSSNTQVSNYVSSLLPNHEIYQLPDNGYDGFSKNMSEFFWDKKHCDSIEAGLDDRARQLLQQRIRCGMESIESEFPPLPTESLVGYGYTYLKAPYSDLKPGTPAIWRKTDLGTTYFVFEEATWSDRAVSIDKTFDRQVEPDGIGIGLLGSLGMAVVNGFLGKVGASIFDNIFGSTTNHFDELYRKIADVLKSSLSQNEVDLVDAKLNGVISFVRNEYNPMSKNGHYSKNILFNALKPHHNTLYDHLGILSHNRYENLGLAGYMACAYEYILLTQELANVDPNVPSYKDSAFLVTVKRFADDALAHVPRVAANLCEARKKFVTVKKFQKGHACGRDVVITTHYQWHDSYTNTWSKEFSSNSNDKKYSPEADCNDRASERKLSVANQLYSELKVEAFLNAMNTLKVKPMP